MRKETQCSWVHHNHGEPGRRPEPPVETERTQARQEWEKARRGQAVAAGALARSALEQRTKLSALQRRLFEVLDDGVGSQLVSHVAAVSVGRGILRMETGEPVVLYDLRLRWEQKILQLVQKRLPDLGIHRVRFALARRQ